MLVLTRREGEEVVIDIPPGDLPRRVVVQLVGIRRDKVRLAFAADDVVLINRRELFDRRPQNGTPAPDRDGAA